MIVFDSVSFSYPDRPVLKEVSFRIPFNERFAILGGSGEGKTTILKLIAGLIKPESGRVIVDGEDITDTYEEDLREIRIKFSILFQEGALFDSLNVMENIAFCMREYFHYSEDELFKRVVSLLKKVGMEESALYLMPDELSGGMHRRVAIARSLAAFNPKMFLYDEPTTGLDPVNATKICNLILDLSRNGSGFIMVTHKVQDALKVAQRFVFIKDGRVGFDGDQSLLLHSGNDSIKAFIRELHLEELQRCGIEG